MIAIEIGTVIRAILLRADRIVGRRMPTRTRSLRLIDGHVDDPSDRVGTMTMMMTVEDMVLSGRVADAMMMMMIIIKTVDTVPMGAMRLDGVIGTESVIGMTDRDDLIATGAMTTVDGTGVAADVEEEVPVVQTSVT